MFQNCKELWIVSIHIHISSSLQFQSNLSLRFGIDFLLLRTPSFSRVVTREGRFPSSSLIDKQQEGLISLLSPIDLIALRLSTDLVAKRSLAF